MGKVGKQNEDRPHYVEKKLIGLSLNYFSSIEYFFQNSTLRILLAECKTIKIDESTLQKWLGGRCSWQSILNASNTTLTWNHHELVSELSL